MWRPEARLILVGAEAGSLLLMCRFPGKEKLGGLTFEPGEVVAFWNRHPLRSFENRQITSTVLELTASWSLRPSVANPQSGNVANVVARAPIKRLLSYFRTIGLLVMRSETLSQF